MRSSTTLALLSSCRCSPDPLPPTAISIPLLVTASSRPPATLPLGDSPRRPTAGWRLLSASGRRAGSSPTGEGSATLGDSCRVPWTDSPEKRNDDRVTWLRLLRRLLVLTRPSFSSSTSCTRLRVSVLSTDLDLAPTAAVITGDPAGLRGASRLPRRATEDPDRCWSFKRTPTSASARIVRLEPDGDYDQCSRKGSRLGPRILVAWTLLWPPTDMS
jgi:hypothetical protein